MTKTPTVSSLLQRASLAATRTICQVIGVISIESSVLPVLTPSSTATAATTATAGHTDSSGKQEHAMDKPDTSSQIQGVTETGFAPKKEETRTPYCQFCQMGGQKENSKKQSGDWRRVLEVYSQRSTIHGVSRLANNSNTGGRASLPKRLFWLFLVLTGCGLFIYQVTERVLYYYQWPVAVNVKVNYNKTLRYPAVTICNQNTFRLSAAAERGMYELLDDMYSTDDLSTYRLDPGNPFNNLSMEELYGVSHRIEDMAVSCWWGQSQCDPADLVATFTDHGLCFSYNLGNTPKQISQTGVDNGLRLMLNIEQYEYMQGPHGAAGLKLLVHDQDEIPFIHDLGEAIPTGLHAFVGVDILQVSNLPSPHGNCSDRSHLEFYDYYSKTACKSDCVTRYTVKACGCKDTYMPELYAGFPPVCDLQTYLSCVVPITKRRQAIEEGCDCPIPCQATHYRPTLSYASTSSLSADHILGSNLTDSLSQHFLHARETAQRVTPAIRQKDVSEFGALKRNKDKVEEILVGLVETMDSLKRYKDSLLEQVQSRIWWHYQWGLMSVKYAIDNDFKRGWQFMDERTFMHVTTGYNQMIYLFREMLNVSETNLRDSWYVSTDRDLIYREELAKRALTNYTHFYWSFKNATPVYKFWRTKDYHYDYNFIYPPLIQHDEVRLDSYYNSVHKHLVEFIECLDTLRSISKVYFETGDYNQTEVNDLLALYEDRSKRFNYYRFFSFTNIVEKSAELADELVEQFLGYNQTLYGAGYDLDLGMYNTLDLINSFRDHTWKEMSEMVDISWEYTWNESLLKRDIAEMLTSRTMEESVSMTATFSRDIRSRAQQVTDQWHKLRMAYNDIWQSMLTEPSLINTFYPHLRKDIDLLFDTENETDYIRHAITALEDMLSSEEEFSQLGHDQLLMLTNADFTDMTPEVKRSEVNRMFQRKEADLLSVMGNVWDLFLDTMDLSQTEMEKYTESIQTDATFVMQNFLEVNVYMRELSYEEIKQYKAYGVIGLLSDIGGAIGLFLGASVISVFELIEVSIQALMERNRQPK